MCRVCVRRWLGDGILRNVTFEVQLSTVPVSDVVALALASWHTPDACLGPVWDLASAARLGVAVNTMCISSPCDGHGCNLTLTLPVDRQYSLKVREVGLTHFL